MRSVEWKSFLAFSPFFSCLLTEGLEGHLELAREPLRLLARTTCAFTAIV